MRAPALGPARRGAACVHTLAPHTSGERARRGAQERSLLPPPGTSRVRQTCSAGRAGAQPASNPDPNPKPIPCTSRVGRTCSARRAGAQPASNPNPNPKSHTLHLTRAATVRGPARRSAAGRCSRPRSRRRRPSSCPPWPAWAGSPRSTCPPRRSRPPRPGESGRGGTRSPRRRRSWRRLPPSPRRRRAGAPAGRRETGVRMRGGAARRARARATAAPQRPRQARPCRRAAPREAPAHELATANLRSALGHQSGRRPSSGDNTAHPQPALPCYWLWRSAPPLQRTSLQLQSDVQFFTHTNS